MNRMIENPAYRRMLKPHCFSDRIAYLEFMISFYFNVSLVMKECRHNSQFRAQMATSAQMMFTKGKAMRQLIEGFNHNIGSLTLKSQPDHTILYTLVRTAYEELCVFELLYMIPDTDDKRTIMRNAYIAAAQVNRLRMAAEGGLDKDQENIAICEQDINDCKNSICATELYKSLTDKDKKKLEDAIFKNGEYQIVITKEGKVNTHVGWDKVRGYCQLGTDVLGGFYRYACNMAHPSYLGLQQFCEAYKENDIEKLSETAMMQMISIMSVYIMDFMKEFPEAKQAYDILDEESQFMVRMYSEAFRNASNK